MKWGSDINLAHTRDVDVVEVVDDDGGGQLGSDINLVHTGEK